MREASPCVPVRSELRKRKIVMVKGGGEVLLGGRRRRSRRDASSSSGCLCRARKKRGRDAVVSGTEYADTNKRNGSRNTSTSGRNRKSRLGRGEDPGIGGAPGGGGGGGAGGGGGGIGREKRSDLLFSSASLMRASRAGVGRAVAYVETTGGACVRAGQQYARDPVVGVAAMLGALLALTAQRAWRELIFWNAMRRSGNGEFAEPPPPSFYRNYNYYSRFASGPRASGSGAEAMGLVVYEGDRTESIEWVNALLRKIWRAYQLNLERWFRRLLSPVINKGATNKRPNLIRSLTVEKFTLDHEPPLFYNMSRRTSRKDSDLNCVVDVRYTGGARMLMLLETGLVRLKVPVEVTDFDVDATMWLKVRLAPLVPYVGTISAAFVGEPNIRVELSPYSRVPLMRMPIIQDFLTKLLTKDLPRLMVLPERLEINIPPALTAVAEAAIGREAVAQAVATAVVNSEAAPFWFKQLTSQAQFAAGGISLPDTYDGELTVLIREARYLRVGGVRGMLDVSDPYCVCVLGAQSVESRRSKSTGDKSYRQGHPVWNQEFQFLVEDKSRQMIHVSIKDSKLTFKPDLGQQVVPLSDLEDGRASARWVRLTPSGRRSRGAQSFGRFLPKRRDPEVLLELTYKAFDDDDEFDSGFREALASRMDPHVKSSDKEIVDIRSAVKATREAAAASAQTAAKVRGCTIPSSIPSFFLCPFLCPLYVPVFVCVCVCVCLCV